MRTGVEFHSAQGDLMIDRFTVVCIIWLAVTIATLTVFWWTEDREQGITWGQLILSPLWAPPAAIVYLALLIGAVIFSAVTNAADLMGLTSIPRRRVRVTIKRAPWWKRPAIQSRHARRVNPLPR
jgi:hypothetical protein